VSGMYVKFKVCELEGYINEIEKVISLIHNQRQTIRQSNSIFVIYICVLLISSAKKVIKYVVQLKSF
jgi:hypothetical protein